MPSLGMVTLNALSAADSVIIPVQAQYLPAKGMTCLLYTSFHPLDAESQAFQRGIERKVLVEPRHQLSLIHI